MRKHGRTAAARRLMVDRFVVMSMYEAKCARIGCGPAFMLGASRKFAENMRRTRTA